MERGVELDANVPHFLREASYKNCPWKKKVPVLLFTIENVFSLVVSIKMKL